jgi:hypothetical protein
MGSARRDVSNLQTSKLKPAVQQNRTNERLLCSPALLSPLSSALPSTRPPAYSPYHYSLGPSRVQLT